MPLIEPLPLPAMVCVYIESLMTIVEVLTICMAVNDKLKKIVVLLYLSRSCLSIREEAYIKAIKS